ncbi:type VI secretion system baseplate subunit TssF [Parendozoicomonas sp. Alg238-R29]|uniref:type VI secretion system baseplate subunit TssF n=1 Tax=Parendozoicomonas sp. Alg238-R29 TaxID=2993446 RepID=UPI00248E009E|nr:type VI secretion system baseplate subunit TssF [Parendozoicomonas sp. Alg238-R29]
MSDSLLQYYSRELEHLRIRARQFSESHPGTATRLGMAGEHIADPHMERLLESIAFLNAKLEKRLDDSYPQLAEALLKRLFPHYLRTIPCMAMAVIKPDPTLKQVTRIPEGTRFETKSDGQSLTFTTAWDIQLTPLEVQFAELEQAPFNFSPRAPASAMLHLRLAGSDSDLQIANLNLDWLTFHFDCEPTLRRSLFDLIIGALNGIIISGGSAGEGRYLDTSHLQPVGENLSLLPEPAVSFFGFQQLMEVLAFSEAFMGFTLSGLRPLLAQLGCRELNIYFLLREASPELSRVIRGDRFKTGCVPVVNLFPCQAEPLVMDYGRMREKIIPDAMAGDNLEVWAINQVTEITRHVPQSIPPLYGKKFGDSDTGLYWLEVGGRDAYGRQHSYLTISDIDYNPVIDDRRVFAIETWCNNGNFPRSLGSGTQLTCLDNIEVSGKVYLLDSPTSQKLPPTGYEAAWALLAHLQLNYEDIFVDRHPEQSLRLLLRMYMRGQNAEGDAWIEALQKITAEPVTAPVHIGGYHCLARGMKIKICIDPDPLRESSLYLLIHTLDRLAANYAGFDSFLQLEFSLQGQHGVHTQCRRHQARQAGL